MIKEKHVGIFLFVSISLLVISIVAYYRGFEIYTFGWHFTHSKPLEWNGLKIIVPQKLIGRYENNNLIVYKLRDPDEITIIFRKMGERIKEGDNFDKLYKKIDFDVIEKNKVRVLGDESIWIKAINKNGENKYLEAVHFLSKPVRILFVGKENNRQVLEKVVKDLK